jgi:hypothetical protein
VYILSLQTFVYASILSSSTKKRKQHYYVLVVIFHESQSYTSISCKNLTIINTVNSYVYTSMSVCLCIYSSFADVCRSIYIYIYIYIYTHTHTHTHTHFLPMAQEPLVGQGFLIIEALRSHSDTPHSLRLLWTSDQPDAETSTC